jgi:enamine deaminase RidA (YjgF/YER057c/UK114 family)
LYLLTVKPPGRGKGFVPHDVIVKKRSPAAPGGEWQTAEMERNQISGHSPFEAVFGFSRAVVVGERVLVAGTAPIPAGGGPPPSSPYEQARLCLHLIGEALGKAGTGLEDVIRTRIYLTDARHWQQVARAHGESFAATRPAATAVIVAGLLDPAWLVEIEAEAIRDAQPHYMVTAEAARH